MIKGRLGTKNNDENDIGILYVVPSQQISGMLTLDTAKKFKVGLFNDITFQAYSNIVGVRSSYNSDYVILARYSAPYMYREPFSSNFVLDMDKAATRSTHGTTTPYFTGLKTNLEEATESILGELFPDDYALEEYKKLFDDFCDETSLSREEYLRIVNEESKILDNFYFEPMPLNGDGDEARGALIFDNLFRHNLMANSIYNEVLSDMGYGSEKLPVYKLKRKK